MGMFNRKPAQVEAHRFDGSTSGKQEMQAWQRTGEWVPVMPRTPENNLTLYLEARGGVDVARSGDWIVREPTGEFSAYTAAAFALTYDEVPDAE